MIDVRKWNNNNSNNNNNNNNNNNKEEQLLITEKEEKNLDAHLNENGSIKVTKEYGHMDRIDILGRVWEQYQKWFYVNF